MNDLALKNALESYTTELIPTVLEILELAGCSDRLCSAVKASIWNQKDASLNKLRNAKRKEENNEKYYEKNYPKNYK